MQVNTVSNEIVAKIVYYGPGLSGKTTNLEQVYARLKPETKGRFLSLKTDEDRTLFFDMVPVDVGQIQNMDLRFQFFTVPGQVYYNASRRQVLQGVDGVIFVADSDQNRLEANKEAMYNLYANMASLGLPAPGPGKDEVPLVVQYNKRDLPGAMPVELLQRELNPENVPAWEGVAVNGVGVFEALGNSMEMVEERLRREL